MITIRKATSEDIYFLSELINIAAKANWPDDYRKKVAEEVCLRDNFTYSWKNGLIAYTEDGEPAGGVFAYDGIVYEKYFENTVHAFNPGREIKDSDRETNSQEFHFESLAVLPQYRRYGIATALINEVKKLYEASNRERLTLAVEIDNPEAIALYQKLGFVDMYNITTVGIPCRKMGIGKW
jgi:ribosomal protein S18 acetylase RimI-like enzyme